MHSTGSVGPEGEPAARRRELAQEAFTRLVGIFGSVEHDEKAAPRALVVEAGAETDWPRFLGVRRRNEETAEVVVWFSDAPPGVREYLREPTQRMALLYPLLNADGEASHPESPAHDIDEFLLTRRLTSDAILGEDDDGALVVNARPHL